MTPGYAVEALWR